MVKNFKLQLETLVLKASKLQYLALIGILSKNI
jgi:hypothetical protein